ncbi:hypothetical protein V8D89_004925 [Ganoderma adspersum]
MSMTSESTHVFPSSDANVRNSHQSPNWSRIRNSIREPAAEFFGVMILVMFGLGGACQTQLSRNTNVSSIAYGDSLSVDFGFAVGLALGAWVTRGISRGHINPAVTIAMATFRRDFPWCKVPVYIFAQVMGGLCGAGIVYANYIYAIDLVEGGRHLRTVPGTASLFATYALPYMTPASAWFEEFLKTVVLLLVVCAMGDPRNKPAPPGLAPLVLFITMLGISASFGMQTGFSINPARDLGPRLLTAMVGYGAPVFTFRRHYWLWCPVLAPIVGALVGTFLYDLFFYSGADSIFSELDDRALENLDVQAGNLAEPKHVRTDVP